VGDARVDYSPKTMTKRRYIARNCNHWTAVRPRLVSLSQRNANDPRHIRFCAAPMEDALSSLSEDFDAPTTGEGPGREPSMLITVDGDSVGEDYAQGVLDR